MSSEVSIEQLQGVRLLAGLGPEHLEPLRAKMKLLEVPAGEALLRQGEPNDLLLVILDGRFRVWRASSGTEMILAEFGGGSVLGELTFIDPGNATATTTALEDARVAALSAADFAEVEKEHPATALALYRSIALTLKERLAETTTLILAHKGIQEAFSEVEELRHSLGQLI